MKQTAVQWIASNLGEHIIWEEKIIDLVEKALEMEKEQIMRAYDIGSNEGYDLAKIDDIKEGHYMKEPIEYYKEIYETQND